MVLGFLLTEDGYIQRHYCPPFHFGNGDELNRWRDSYSHGLSLIETFPWRTEPPPLTESIVLEPKTRFSFKNLFLTTRTSNGEYQTCWMPSGVFPKLKLLKTVVFFLQLRRLLTWRSVHRWSSFRNLHLSWELHHRAGEGNVFAPSGCFRSLGESASELKGVVVQRPDDGRNRINQVLMFVFTPASFTT